MPAPGGVDSKVVSEYIRLGSYRVTVIEQQGRRFFDMRQFVESKEPGGYTGYTKRGFRCDAVRFALLCDLLRLNGEAIVKLLNEGGVGYGNKAAGQGRRSEGGARQV